MKRCAQNPMLAEFSLCGDAFDAFASGDAPEPHVIAAPDQTINCPECCAAVREIKKMRNPLRPRSAWLEQQHLKQAEALK